MRHDLLTILVANLSALSVTLLFNRWRKGTHIGAYIVTLTVVWAWLDGRLPLYQAIACVIGVVLIGAEMSGKLKTRRGPLAPVHDEQGAPRG